MELCWRALCFLLLLLTKFSVAAENAVNRASLCPDKPELAILKGTDMDNVQDITDKLDSYSSSHGHGGKANNDLLREKAFYFPSPSSRATALLTLQCRSRTAIQIRIKSLMPSKIQNLQRYVIPSNTSIRNGFLQSDCHAILFDVNLNDFRSTGTYICQSLTTSTNHSLLIFTNGVTSGTLLETDSVVDNILPDQNGFIYIPCIASNPYAKIRLFREFLDENSGEEAVESTNAVSYSIGRGFRVNVSTEHYHSRYLCAWESFEERIFLHENFYNNGTHFLISPPRKYLTSADIQIQTTLSDSSTKIVFTCESNDPITFDFKHSNRSTFAPRYLHDVSSDFETRNNSFYQYHGRVTLTFDLSELSDEDRLELQCLRGSRIIHDKPYTENLILHNWIFERKVVEYSQFVFEATQRFSCGLKSSVFPGLLLVVCDNDINCDLAYRNEARVWHDFESFPFEKVVTGRPVEITNNLGVRISGSLPVSKEINHGIAICQDVSLYEKESDNPDPISFFRARSGTLFEYPKSKYSITEVMHIAEFNESVMYEAQNLTLACETLSSIFAKPILMYFEFGNGTLLNLNINQHQKTSNTTEIMDTQGWLKLELQTTITSVEIRKIVCMAANWHDDSSWSRTEQLIHIEAGTFPSITNQKARETVSADLGTRGTTLTCEAFGNPIPSIIWAKEGRAVLASLKSSGVSIEEHVDVDKKQIISTVTIAEIKTLHFGSYYCTANNVKGKAQREYLIQPLGKGTQVTIYISVALGCLLMLCMILFVFFWKRMRNRPLLTKEDLEEFELGNPKMLAAARRSDSRRNSTRCTRTGSIPEIGTNEMEPLGVYNLGYNKSYEIPFADLAIDRDVELGSGEFGIVWKGKLWKASSPVSIPVAIKTFKRTAEREYIKALLCEIKMMGYIGKHEYVLEFLGAVTTNVRQGKLYIVVEYCDLRSLEKYLRCCRPSFVNQLDDDCSTIICDPLYSNMHELGTDGSNPLTTTDLVRISCQIVQGMDFLSKKRIVHADLACRNILLTENRTAKICDFGLSRQLYKCAEYSKTTKTPLPWRWMALESLLDLTFSTKSDVWSFGVTVWELFSLAQVPFAGLSWTSEFVQDLSQGLRPGRPRYCPANIYHILTVCWESNPDQRPAFSTLADYFQKFYPAHENSSTQRHETSIYENVGKDQPKVGRPQLTSYENETTLTPNHGRLTPVTESDYQNPVFGKNAICETTT